MHSRIPLKNRIHYPIWETGRDRDNRSDSLVDLVTVRCTHEFPSTVMPPKAAISFDLGNGYVNNQFLLRSR
jgi:hypothetical protein